MSKVQAKGGGLRTYLGVDGEGGTLWREVVHVNHRPPRGTQVRVIKYSVNAQGKIKVSSIDGIDTKGGGGRRYITAITARVLIDFNENVTTHVAKYGSWTNE